MTSPIFSLVFLEIIGETVSEFGKSDTADIITIIMITVITIIPKTFLSTLYQNENTGKKVMILN